MAIHDEMFKLIELEIHRTIEEGKVNRNINIEKAKDVAKMLTMLSVDPSEPDNLTNQYIVNIKNICSSQSK